ncbi:MAG: hypothetical protein JKX98_00070 [Alcanivoracaceae bacterium]|nr:hypothetical protein [Alcanivoracaceae bacterium]
MKKKIFNIFIITILLTSCGGGSSNKKRNLDSSLFKYAAFIRWSNFDAALTYLNPDDKSIIPSSFELQRLKQFKVSQYLESPITPGNEENIVFQNVEIQLYNIHTNIARTIYDHQSWGYNDKLKQWFLTSGLPKL